MKTKIKKRVIMLGAAAILLLMLNTVKPVGAATINTNLRIDSNGFYAVASIDDLVEMKAMIEGTRGARNDGSTFDYTSSNDPYGKFILTSDINFYAPPNPYIMWEPIKGFKGEFNGNGKTITNLQIGLDGDHLSGLGFFESLDAGSKVYGVNFDNANIVENTSGKGLQVTDTMQNAGVLAGSIIDSTVTNVSITNSDVLPKNAGFVPAGFSVRYTGVLTGNIDTDKATISGISISGSNCTTPVQGLIMNIDTATVGTADTIALNGTTPPTPVPTPTATPTASPTATPTVTPSATPTAAPPQVGDVITQSGVSYKVLEDGACGYVSTEDETVKDVVIPDTITTESGDTLKITRIQRRAFDNNKNIETVTFGKFIDTVEDNAFCNCTSLKRFTSSPVLRYIGTKAFYNCKSLILIKLPKTVEFIGTACFKNCVKLKQAHIGVNKAQLVFSGFTDSLQIAGTINITISASAFDNCSSLSKVIINIQVKVIGNSAFNRCKALRSIVVYSKQLRTVGKKALKGVHNCKITVPKIKLKPYKVLFKNRGQGKKVVVIKM